MKPKNPTEHQEQSGFVYWFRNKYPQHVLISVPNGEKRNIAVAKRLKKEGVLPGAPDIIIFLDEGEKIMIEFKKQGGRLSKVQKELHKKLLDMKHEIHVVYSAEEASRLFLKIMEERK